MNTYYKVVAIERKNKKVIRRSYLHKRLNKQMPESMVVEYPFGKPARPQVSGTKLMVFGNKQQAIRFQGGIDQDLEVWACKVTNPVQIYHVCTFNELPNTAPISLQEIWYDLLKYDEDSHLDWILFRRKVGCDRRYSVLDIINAPCHTFACDSVTITKRVK